MAFKDGDFVRIDYSAWRVADNKLTYTTSKETAEKNGVYDKDARYAPTLVVIGKNNAIKGVENAVKQMQVSETKKVEIEPKDAFGERNSDLVKIMPLSDFRKKDLDPYPGMRIELDNIPATVKSVTSGRVVVDANHLLAGEKMLYEIKVVEKVENDDAKVKAIAEIFSLTPDSVSSSAGSVKVAFGDKTEKNADYLLNKSSFVEAIFRFMDSVKHVDVDEGYMRKEETKKEEATSR